MRSKGVWILYPSSLQTNWFIFLHILFIYHINYYAVKKASTSKYSVTKFMEQISYDWHKTIAASICFLCEAREPLREADRTIELSNEKVIRSIWAEETGLVSRYDPTRTNHGREDGRGMGERWARDGRGMGEGWARDGREMGDEMGEGGDMHCRWIEMLSLALAAAAAAADPRQCSSSSSSRECHSIYGRRCSNGWCYSDLPTETPANCGMLRYYCRSSWTGGWETRTAEMISMQQ